MNPVHSSKIMFICLLAFAGFLGAGSLGARAQTGVPDNHRSGWPQWGLNAQHTLFDADVTAQTLNTNIVNLIYDSNIDDEKADPTARGTLLVHYQSPPIYGNDT